MLAFGLGRTVCRVAVASTTSAATATAAAFTRLAALNGFGAFGRRCQQVAFGIDFSDRRQAVFFVHRLSAWRGAAGIAFRAITATAATATTTRAAGFFGAFGADFRACFGARRAFVTGDARVGGGHLVGALGARAAARTAVTAFTAAAFRACLTGALGLLAIATASATTAAATVAVTASGIGRSRA